MLLAEANTIQFVAKTTTIPVPKIYCAFVDQGTTYIIMQKIKGEPIAAWWLMRSEESRDSLLAQLKSMMDQLRSVQPPFGTGVHNIMAGPLIDIWIKAYNPPSNIWSIPRYQSLPSMAQDGMGRTI